MPRYFCIPEDFEIEGSDRGDGKPLTIGWVGYHHIAVWSDERWIKSSDAYRMQMGLRALFAAAKPGDEVGIDDDVFGIYQEILKTSVPPFAQSNLMHMAAHSNRVYFIGPTLDAARLPNTESPVMYGREREIAKKATARNRSKAARRARR